ncbi:MAG: NAD(P)-binding protein, partial [Myxococcales bacterium]|nr:NAD(P)-binding protein [Myxococcales bacterium]
MKRRIAVLGGGIGALSTVYELTNRPGFKDRFEITVYQMGHRLGGKGASGVNRLHHDRIEEHGLHIFWGFYENAFRMMREVYAELGRPPSAPLATFEDAFFSHDLIVVPEVGKDGERSYWPLRMPRNERVPGDGLDDLLEPWDYVPRLLGWLLTMLGFDRHEDPPIAEAASGICPSDLARGSALERALRTVGEALLSTMVHVSRVARALLPVARDLAIARALAQSPTDSPSGRASSVLFLIRHSQRCFDRLIESGETDVRLRTQVDLALTLLRGLLADGLVIPPRDFHALDDESLRGWLARHGARAETLSSPLLEGLHAAIYSSGLEIAAGTAVHGLLRIAFTYKGSILWKMRAGMGETIFAPLYEVLRRRGVRFELFHAVDKLRLSPDRTHIAHIDMTV